MASTRKKSPKRQTSDTPAKSDKTAGGKASEPSDISGKVRGTLPTDITDLSDAKQLPEWLTSLIIQTVQAEAKRFLEGQTIPKSLTTDLPPSPPEKIEGPHRRKVNPGKRVKVGTSIDAELVRLLEQWRKERGLTLNRALDTVLWSFFGKPKLSFEITDKSDD